MFPRWRLFSLSNVFKRNTIDWLAGIIRFWVTTSFRFRYENHTDLPPPLKYVAFNQTYSKIIAALYCQVSSIIGLKNLRTRDLYVSNVFVHHFPTVSITSPPIVVFLSSFIQQEKWISIHKFRVTAFRSIYMWANALKTIYQGLAILPVTSPNLFGDCHHSSLSVLYYL